MHFLFTKMEGAGNDFILSTASPEEFSPEKIALLCHRKFGIGADGMIFLSPLSLKEGEEAQLSMAYFNSDGSSAEMCGNGLRCSASFAYKNGLSNGKKKMLFYSGTLIAPAEILDEKGERVQILLEEGEKFREYSDGETLLYKGIAGVPHAIMRVPSELQDSFDVDAVGRKYRFSPLFAPEGANIDFLFFTEEERKKGLCHIRTYERGVEGETLSCGTGCASSGIVLYDFFDFPEKIRMICRSGTEIGIDILKECNILKKVHLTGPARTVFEGSMEI